MQKTAIIIYYVINEKYLTFLGAVRVPSTSNKAIKPGFLVAIGVDVCNLQSNSRNCKAFDTTNVPFF